ncbi:MAG: FkbM family methyltransferase [Blastocatellia bacterium]
MILPRLVHQAGSLPGIGALLRRTSYIYREGSVVTIPFGKGAGAKWRRHHRYVSGYWLGIYEPKMQTALSRLVCENDVVYDVGANAGFFTLLAARLAGNRGRVFAFEPLFENAESIREQVEVNNLGNCEVVRAAVSDVPGSAPFTITENNSMGRMAGTDEQGELTVETISIDSFAGANQRPNVIKIDVEGAEVKVLEGAALTLSSAPAPKLLIELHGHEVATQVASFLSGIGFSLFDLDFAPITSGVGQAHHVVALPPERK